MDPQLMGSACNRLQCEPGQLNSLLRCGAGFGRRAICRDVETVAIHP
jgi:hypothetical protein